MKYSFLILCLILIFSIEVKSQEYPGFKVVGRHLFDKCGEKVVLRGVSNPNIWFEKDGEVRYAEIEQTGANVVRIVWQTDGSVDDLDLAIENCYSHNMIPMIELHDATGDWSLLQKCIDYWVRSDVIEVIQKHEEYLLLNIANECGDGNVTKAAFRSGYISAVDALRDAGIHVPLVIDAASYGQSANILQSEGPSLIEADPDHNLLFSVHMWWPKMYGFTEKSIVNEIAESVKMELPMIVGEFSQMHGSCTESEITSENSIAYKTIIRECQNNKVGYIAWSWFGNCNPLWDMSTKGTFATLYDWGLEVAVTDSNSIKNTSVRPYSIVHGDCNPDTTTVTTELLLDGKEISLKNIPNPAFGSTEIWYSLPNDMRVELSVYDVKGRKIETLVNSIQKKGTYSIPYCVSDLRNGVYYYSVVSDGFKSTQKMIVIN